jgi:hypothetical protein
MLRIVSRLTHLFAKLMTVERRKMSRGRFLKSGTILLGSWEVPCRVRNLSEIGACLELQTTVGIPAVFQFTMQNKTPQICKVMWRDYTKLGVHFRMDALTNDATARTLYHQAAI